MFGCLKEPCFNTLRTNEQLGYIVQSGFSSNSKVLGGTIMIQSSKYGPEYLESRINAFLQTMKKDDGKVFLEEKIENVKKA